MRLVEAFQSTRPSRASTNEFAYNNLELVFQSTRPSRASTGVAISLCNLCQYFNPQGPHGPRHMVTVNCFPISTISIHKALTGLDNHFIKCRYDFSNFNPQGPHGPRRMTTPVSGINSSYFNPQGPHGPRPHVKPSIGNPQRFQSTRPSRAST